mmetsp:Transcript_8859/g.16039  ORF Transcript_8859/g.16039 Transcript_8859/m.16039 type:complete len:286 (-) Transcript_8859:161-1018(-)|eukprot:CAMPEP_0202499356 /NCGR_PEP_ID=MMETSP1361-20130828/29506_1 /ASSEMBLY_ACC=CAM_ASM_000849 /TAXON_ID=210615 /ORGANISM="Staurosira complex sp., Strain CCMP2646" /LENGTH=285 /DNA_ID=CAMNT_0049131529 /DNA_START=82 /DNA_END=939 /DNA_ORIENTATION=+
MAAVLCQGIGQACAGLIEILEAVLYLPCRACGCACTGLGEVLTSPFFPYSALTFGLNVPPIVLGIQGMMQTSCASIDKWFLVNAILCLVHCLACLYIIHRIQNDPIYQQETAIVATPVTPNQRTKQSFTASVFGSKSDAVPTPTAPPEKKSFTASIFGSKTGDVEKGSSYSAMGAQPVEATPVPTTTASPIITKSTTRRASDHAGNSTGRIKHVLCYDGGVAIYIILFIIWIVWQSMGVGRLLSFNLGNCGGNEVAGKLTTSLICGYCYMSFVGIGFVCSLCCLR